MSVRKSYQQRPKHIRLFLVLTAVFGFLFMISFGREYVGNLQIRHEIKRLEQERDTLQSEQSEQLLELQRLSSTYYLEKEAREKHGLSAPGEQVYIVKDDPFSVRNDAAIKVEEAPAPKPVWQQWLEYFFVHVTKENYEGDA